MNVEWDYSRLAASYAARPPYAPAAVDWIVATSGAPADTRCCDVGAGTGHLTTALLDRGLRVDAVEPNEQMRRIGIEVTGGRDVRWWEATAESTGLDAGTYRLVTFGSSFNVVDRPAALAEAARLLAADGWFACLWNHRDLDDPTQREIQAAIERRVPEYRHGVRREDQAEVIAAAGPFVDIMPFAERVVHTVDAGGWSDGWLSHATLARQAGADFAAVTEDIRAIAMAAGPQLEVPYTTRGWLARRRG